eukprot:7391326-Prymnesium_polylepis.1
MRASGFGAALPTKHAVSASESPQHNRLISDLLPVVADTDAQERGVGLRSCAVHLFTERCIHPVFFDSSSADFNLNILWQGQGLADRTEACRTSHAVSQKRRKQRGTTRLNEDGAPPTGCNATVSSGLLGFWLLGGAVVPLSSGANLCAATRAPA